ncbi:helix-turn-helix transcriptional regulator [Myxacorys almedinensis]|uniref:Helix-turn-helix domain-containing protein n=1 Tax=Myxacorys almedinensis A TaxID=2690445 RepID=A0A8J7Z4U5_9CYAN|nr:AraC family transcriptional regulator [Myxacorys almedinensis]NDJ19824.1 helix-turn-helix domain-containing protein [Myxacorys almedinensis A]
MTLILTPSDWDELCQQAPITCPQNFVLDEFEVLTGVPEYLGRGCNRVLELSPGMWLTLSDEAYCRDWMFKEPEHDHPIQIGICLSGFMHCDIHPKFGGTRSYFSGSGVSPAYVEQNHAGKRIIYVNVGIEPEVLKALFLGDRAWQSEPMQQLFKGEDWKVSFYPTVTARMRSLAQQMWNAPYRGAVKRMYLQAKVLELLAMQLDWLDGNRSKPSDGQLKPTTLNCIYHAREILSANLEQPPSVLELAQRVGVSDRTLQRGFRELFGKTVFGYLTEQRMELAEQWLRQGNCTIAEIATMVGYSNPGHFTAAFKRKFGITPRECLLGKMSVLE